MDSIARWQPGKRSLLISPLLGVLFTFAFSPYPLGFIAYIIFIPLILLASRHRFLSGFLFGIGHFSTLLYWILFLDVPPVTRRWLILGVVVLIGYLALYYGLLTLGISYLGPISLPFLIVILEYLRSRGELGFPWGLLGYTQVHYLPVLQIAAGLGIYGVSFFVAGVNFLIYLAIRRRKFLYLILPPLILGLGWAMMGRSEKTTTKVGLLQPNINTNQVWTRSRREETMEKLIRMTDSLARAGARLVIWPESSMPLSIFHHKRYQKGLIELADSDRIAILLGTSIFEDHNLYNGAILIVPDSGVVGHYKKIHLVPFSEHLPYEERFHFLKGIDFGQGDYSPGKESTVFSWGSRFGCLICFESIFPELSRRYATKVDFLVNITNDGWFGDSPGLYQHADMAIVRAVEFRIPLIRVANTGISMVVDPYGRVLVRTPAFETIGLVVVVPQQSRSLYLELGDVIFYLSLIFVFISAGRSWWSYHRRR
ncbi:apolipoprotein N-acyltransferase [candidate division WOR-3 bacterium]|uniref:Apolipoprotein N-acyltransferase n=1 Tax=candidate division WOR-3 bacterium TaxID=2052148 RepID=A0A660SLK8_UNCW3|nr:MAG: apolipoprotein N-acyltransferase [candidate division WOR-3 bacterium]